MANWKTLLGNKTLLFSKWRQKPTRPILRYSSVVNMEKGNFTNFENWYKINETSHNDNFSPSDDQDKKETSISEKLGVSGGLTYDYLFPTLLTTNLMVHFHEQPSSSDMSIIPITPEYILLTIAVMSWQLMIIRDTVWL